MSIVSVIGRRLSMFNSMGLAARVQLKSAKYQPFVATVKDFIFEGGESFVVFARIPDTIFPNDTPTEQAGTFTVPIKNVKAIERIN